MHTYVAMAKIATDCLLAAAMYVIEQGWIQYSIWTSQLSPMIENLVTQGTVYTVLR